MNHLCTGICLLMMVCYSYRVKLGYRIIASEYCTRIFPCYCRACFHLSPEEFAVFTLAYTPFGYKVENSSLSACVSGIPVLNRDTSSEPLSILPRHLSSQQFLQLQHEAGFRPVVVLYIPQDNSHKSPLRQQ